VRYLLLLLTVAALLVGLHLTLLYGFTPYATMQAELRAAAEQGRLAVLPQPSFEPALTPARYAVLRGVGGIFLLGSLLRLALSWRDCRRQMHGLMNDVRRGRRVIRVRWRGMSRGEAWLAVAWLSIILLVRYWFLRHSAFNPDELVSSDYFVQPGPRVAAGFYLLPNNHIFYNLLACIAGQLPGAENLSPELLLRLPSFILGFVATVLTYICLTGITSFRVATLTIGLFQLLPEEVLYTVSARGYGLQMACIAAVFFAVVVLLRGLAFRRLAWAVLVGASLAGFYSIPTFVYPFICLQAGLWGGLFLQRYWVAAVVQALVAGVGVVLLAIALYLPVGMLSGWAALVANPYVAQLTTAHFWQYFGPYYLWGTVGALLGQPAATVPLLLGLLLLGPLLVWRWALPAWRPVVALGCAVVLGLLPLLMVQRVFAPPRTVHYVGFFIVILCTLLLEAVVRQLRLRAGWAWAAGAVIVLGYGSYRLPSQARGLLADQQFRKQAQQASQWLRRQHPRHVFTNAYGYNLYIRHLALAGRQQPLPVQLQGDGPIANSYDYLMLLRGQPLPVWAALQPYRLAYLHADLAIYRLTGPL
jgi:hypothetical protein